VANVVAMTRTLVRYQGKPPEGVNADFIPTWDEHFSPELARQCLTRYYGPDWTLQRQETYVTEWEDVA
jgi:hypothetical protein